MKKSYPKKKLFFFYCVVSVVVFIYITCIFLPWLIFPIEGNLYLIDFKYYLLFFS